MSKEEIRTYLAKIGSKGGKKSKRKITPEQQAKMQAARKKKDSTGKRKKDSTKE